MTKPPIPKIQQMGTPNHRTNPLIDAPEIVIALCDNQGTVIRFTNANTGAVEQACRINSWQINAEGNLCLTLEIKTTDSSRDASELHVRRLQQLWYEALAGEEAPAPDGHYTRFKSI